MKFKALAAFVVSLAITSHAVGQTPAKLDPQKLASCQAALKERGELERAGLRATLAAAPQLRASALSADEVNKLRRLIRLDEIVMFECRIVPHPALAPGTRAKNTAALAVAEQLANTPLPVLPARRPKTVPMSALRATIRPKSSPSIPIPTRRP